MKRSFVSLALLLVASVACDDESETGTSRDGSMGSSLDSSVTSNLDSRGPDAPGAGGTGGTVGTVDSAVIEGNRDAATPVGGGDAAVICTPAAARCTGNVAEVCSAAGTVWTSVTCSNGCVDGICMPLSLETGWKVHQYDLLDDGIKTPARYTFSNGGLVATQAANPMASVYYNDTPLPEGVVVTGRFGVHTTSDDDFVGFVFGWQDPQHTYLFDWKQAPQNYSGCGLASAGASLKVINAATPIDKCADVWRSTGTERVKPLVTVDTNAVGWKDNVDYDLRLVFRPGNISIEIFQGATRVVSIISTDTTYRSGKFGFYNYSQEAVRYEAFSISPSP